MTDNQNADDELDEEVSVTDPTELKYVGPATATVLADASFGPERIVEKTVSYDMLTDAGVNPGVAARIRREHSLSWSFDGDGDGLEERSSQVRGLKDGEREWIAASTGNWEDAKTDTTATADGGGTAEDAESAWRERSSPEPVTVIDGVNEEYADQLAEGGITSVRTLALANPDEIIDSIELDRDELISWRDAARERE